MTTILQEAAAGRATVVPWTVERYRRAIETGFVPEDRSVELIDGFIVQTWIILQARRMCGV